MTTSQTALAEIFPFPSSISNYPTFDGMQEEYQPTRCLFLIFVIAESVGGLCTTSWDVVPEKRQNVHDRAILLGFDCVLKESPLFMLLVPHLTTSVNLQQTKLPLLEAFGDPKCPDIC